MKEIIFTIFSIIVAIGLIKKTFKLMKWIIIISALVAVYRFVLPLL
ncbi:MAG: hypothetical protein KBA67_01965 [Leptotrichiaceae bacterium]|nr:hypothetical protein [Leptotrichiaceae bacterium]MBP6281639.1 hypothetical protein [Leptotrichiaceae bacterium]MBP7100276.1 hypothetical protein [Leptotrichiaceae bacterium]MBP7739222.1 hypothetical protein [Leptotrichiaceae bacterium]MBP9629050.1 hypothetical protein [Leptotrichiaceae bacterium]